MWQRNRGSSSPSCAVARSVGRTLQGSRFNSKRRGSAPEHSMGQTAIVQGRLADDAGESLNSESVTDERDVSRDLSRNENRVVPSRGSTEIR